MLLRIGKRETEKRQTIIHSNISKESKRRKKVPLRPTKNIDSDTIVDKT